MPGAWSVAITQPQAEAKAVAHAIQQGFECYFPRIKERNIIQPLFPRYVFVQAANRWRALANVIGMAGYVPATDGKPAMIGDAEIARIKTLCGADGIYVPPPKPRFKVNQEVRVSKGAFEGHLGIYAGMLPKQRAEVLFGLVRTSIRESDLVAA